MRIQAVLFDADGVMQKRPRGWRDALGERLGFRGDPGAFLADVFDAETPALTGQSDFPQALSNLLARWHCRATLDEVLHTWTMIEVDSESMETIRALRRCGVRCHLASNQERYKARYMSDVLGYGRLFDTEFYSCHMGLKKPSGAYFRAIVSAIALPPNQLLFVDDLSVNVDAAREVGLHAVTFHLETGAGGAQPYTGSIRPALRLRGMFSATALRVMRARQPCDCEVAGSRATACRSVLTF